MPRFVVGEDPSQSTLFPERLDDYLGEDRLVIGLIRRRESSRFLAAHQQRGTLDACS
jgi:hypothetical protein